ncbi:exosortase [Chlorogloea sp. CCALA 695]|nr:exosortase [Chlorogloea sp. CCALA 695]
MSSGLVISLGLSLQAEEAKAVAFTFTNIADSRGSFSDFYIPLGDGVFVSDPAINDKGTVVFQSFLDAGGEGIFTGSGGETTTIANTSGSFSRFADNEPTINNEGTVAFFAGLDTGGQGIFTSSGGEIAEVADLSDLSSSTFVYNPAINDEGTVAFSTSGPGGSGILTSSGSETTKVVDNSSPFFASVSDPAINNDGTVAFRATLEDAEGQGIFTSSGGEITTIVDNSGSFDSIINPVINNEGTVAFEARLDDTGGNGIFTGSGGETTTIADNSGAFSSFIDLALNDQGTVAFQAALDAGGEGIFTGSDLFADKVIATGDSLFGSTVTSLFFQNNGLNNSGQIVFTAGLADGTQGVFRAEPVPEPSEALGTLALGVLGVRYLLKRKQKKQ